MAAFKITGRGALVIFSGGEVDLLYGDQLLVSVNGGPQRPASVEAGRDTSSATGERLGLLIRGAAPEDLPPGSTLTAEIDVAKSPRHLLVSLLRRAIDAHERDDIAALNDCADAADQVHGRTTLAKLSYLAVQFLLGWADSANHDWLYYNGITRADWPKLGDQLAASLLGAPLVLDQRVLDRFAPDRAEAAQGAGRGWLVVFVLVLVFVGIVAGSILLGME